MPNGFFSGEFFDALAASGIGSLVGTVFKMMRRPPQSVLHAIGGAFTAIFVGTMVGGICSEYFHLGPWVTSSAAAAAAYISDEILRGIEAHGQRLKQGKLPFPPKKDS